MGSARSGAFATALGIAASQNGQDVSFRRTCRLHAAQTTRLVMIMPSQREAASLPPLLSPSVAARAAVCGVGFAGVRWRDGERRPAVGGIDTAQVLKAARATERCRAVLTADTAHVLIAARAAETAAGRSARGPVGRR